MANFWVCLVFFTQTLELIWYFQVVVIASFLVNMIADGVTFSFGVLFDKLEEEFGESKAVTAGVVSLFHAVPLLSGPVASALTDR